MRKKIWIIVAGLALMAFIITWGRDTNWSYFYTGIDDHALKYHKWKCVRGDYLGDFLYFRSEKWPDCDICVDQEYNIYFKGIKKGRVVNTTVEHLTVKSLNGCRGYYVPK